MKNSVRAVDMLLSLSRKLPKNLLLDASSEEGQFTANFLLKLKYDQLCALEKEAKKKDGDSFYLFFFTVSEKDYGKKAPVEVKDFQNFDFSKVKNIHFNGGTTALSSPDHISFVTVIFVLGN